MALILERPRREWYSYHFPELIKIVSDNKAYARVAGFIGNRKELSEDKIRELREIVLDDDKCDAIIEAARVSMGGWVEWVCHVVCGYRYGYISHRPH